MQKFRHLAKAIVYSHEKLYRVGDDNPAGADEG